MYPAPEAEVSAQISQDHDGLTNELGDHHSSELNIFEHIFERKASKSFGEKFLPETCNGLFAYGRLYHEQLFSEATPAQKCVLAAVTNLCESPWAKAHGNAINLDNWVISYRTNKFFNSDRIARHINDLEKLDLIHIRHDKKTRWLSINRSDEAQEFLPIIALEDKSLSYPESILLSVLFDASCIYARSDLDFILPNSSIAHLGEQLMQANVFSKDTLKKTLNLLQSKGFLSLIGENSGAIEFNQELSSCYRNLFKVQYSPAANELLNTRAIAKVVKYVDTPLTRTIRSQKQDLVPAGVEPIDVIDTNHGLIFVEKDGFTDINGCKTPLNSDLPYYENSLEQRNNFRVGESFSKVESFSLTSNSRYFEVKRNEFYALSEKDQWVLTLDDAFNNVALAQETVEPYKFTPAQLKHILVNGLANQDKRTALTINPFTTNIGSLPNELVKHDREHAIAALKSYEKGNCDHTPATLQSVRQFSQALANEFAEVDSLYSTSTNCQTQRATFNNLAEVSDEIATVSSSFNSSLGDTEGSACQPASIMPEVDSSLAGGGKTLLADSSSNDGNSPEETRAAFIAMVDKLTLLANSSSDHDFLPEDVSSLAGGEKALLADSSSNDGNSPEVDSSLVGGEKSLLADSSSNDGNSPEVDSSLVGGEKSLLADSSSNDGNSPEVDSSLAGGEKALLADSSSNDGNSPEVDSSLAGGEKALLADSSSNSEDFCDPEFAYIADLPPEEARDAVFAEVKKMMAAKKKWLEKWLEPSNLEFYKQLEEEDRETRLKSNRYDRFHTDEAKKSADLHITIEVRKFEFAVLHTEALKNPDYKKAYEGCGPLDIKPSPIEYVSKDFLASTKADFEERREKGEFDYAIPRYLQLS